MNCFYISSDLPITANDAPSIVPGEIQSRQSSCDPGKIKSLFGRSNRSTTSVLALLIGILFPLFAQAQNILTSGTGHSGAIALGETDSWSFAANAGDSLMVRVGSPSFAPRIRVFDSSNVLVAEVAAASSSNRDNYVLMEAAAGGTLTVLINPAIANQSGAYTVHLARAPAIPGDDAKPLINGASHQDELPVGGLDVWSFNANQGDGLMLRMGARDGSSLSPWIRLYGPDGALIEEATHASSFNRDNHLTATAPATGVYTVVVSAMFLNQTGAYLLNLGRAPVRAGDQDSELINGFAVLDALPMGGLDLFSFNANQGDSLMVRMGARSGSSLSPWIRLYGPNGALIEQASHASSFNRDNFVTATAPETGVHTVVISAAHLGQSGNYGLHLARAPGEISVAEEDEGGELLNGAIHTGRIDVGDLDVWNFEAAQGDGLMLRMGATEGALTPWIRLYGPDGELVEEATAASSFNRDNILTLQAPDTGIYTVAASAAHLGQSGNYALHLARSPGDFIVSEGDNGGPLTNGVTHTGTMTIGDMDMWSFIGTPGDSNVLTVVAVDFTPRLRVYGPSGELVREVTSASSFNRTATLAHSVTNSGPHTVVLTAGHLGQSGRYTLKQSRVPPDLIVPETQLIDEGEILEVFISAENPDEPAKPLQFHLISGPPGANFAAAGTTRASITWATSEVDGPSTNVFVATVTDVVNGHPFVRTNSFTVIVNEMNTPPQLTVPANQSVNELSTLNISASATDADLPPNELTFFLVSSPPGMVIDPVTGAMSWTPTEAQGPGEYEITVRVTDHSPHAVNEQELSDTKTFMVTVNEVNHPPQLTVPSSQVVDELSTLNVSVSATDPDLPPNELTFSLVSPPDGMVINPATGAITWTSTEEQGPGEFEITVRVTDHNPIAVNEQQLSDTRSFMVTVHEVNHPPAIDEPADASAQLGRLMTVTVTATDPDIPANTLTFSLDQAPSGMTIDGSTGVISWTPLQEHVGSHSITVRVTDDGSPPLSDTAVFRVMVTGEGSSLAISRLSGNGLGQISITGDIGLDYELQVSTDLLDWTRLIEFRLVESPHIFIDPATATQSTRFYRLRLIPQ
jgi:hypothetical protein